MSATVVTEGWFVDPLARYDGRYFDGDHWTDQISHDGVLRTDPEWPPIQVQDQVAPEPEYSGPERRSGGERRQIGLRTDEDTRHHDRRCDS